MNIKLIHKKYLTQMTVKNRCHKKIEEELKNIFNTEIKKGNEVNHHNNSDSIIAIVEDSLVKHQIIQLAKLCQETPHSVTLKRSPKGIFIEFW